MRLLNVFNPPTIDWPKKYQLRENRSNHSLLKQFYAQGVPSPDTPIEDVQFLAIDLETTGLNSNKHDIITIGAVPFTLNRIYLNHAKEWMVKPRRKLNEESIIIHGITHSDIASAPDFTSVMSELVKMMTGKVMVAHYLSIERLFLDKAFKLRINEGIEFPIIDTMTLEERIIKKSQHRLFRFNHSPHKSSARLALSRRRYGLPDYTSHHALTDAIATAELLQAQIMHYFSPHQEIKHFWL